MKAVEEMIEMPVMIEISSKKIPEIKNWKVGETYRFTDVSAKQISVRLEDKGEMSARFEIKSIKANGEHKEKK